MRRPLALVAFAATLAFALPASADLRPVRRDFGEIQVPRIRVGSSQAPVGHATGRMTVVVRLGLPPLAAAEGRSLYGGVAKQKLNVRSASARVHLARVAAQQNAAVAELRRQIPEATVSRRFAVLLNGITVTVPNRRLPALVRMSFATKVFPSIRYTLALNDSPSVIGAPQLSTLTGVRGEGMKIAVVDDGVDQANPFFDPAGFQYPEGYPRGGRKWTTPKVIVARAFPGPNSGKRGRWAYDPRSSFHGTHVAGIAAGNAGTTAPAGRDHPRVEGLSGVAPRAWIGNYRVFNVPTPVGNVANTPEILAAFEAAVVDGMDVINFSGGGAQTEPANDPSYEVIPNIARAGVVPVIAAGNDREEFGFGSAGSPGTVPEAISVAATSNAQVFSPALTVTAPNAPLSLNPIPFSSAAGAPTPLAWGSADQTLVDVGAIVGTNSAPVDRLLCGSGANPNTGSSTLPSGSLNGVIALASRGTCTFVSKAQRAKAAGAVGLILVDNRPGEPNGIPVALAIPGGMISDLDGSRLRTLMSSSGGRTTVRVGRDPERIQTGRSGIITSFSSGGPTSFGHDLKPDISAPGGSILSSTAPRLVNSPFAVFDGTSMAAPHIAGGVALLLQRHPSWSTQQVKSALVSTAGPAWADTARTFEAPVILEGGGLANLPVADDPKVFTDPVSISFDDLNVNSGARSVGRLVRISDAGDGAGTWTVELRPQNATAGAGVRLTPALSIAPGGEADLAVTATAASDAAAGDNFGFIVLRRGVVTRRIPYYFAVTRPGLESAPIVKLKQFQVGDTIEGPSRATMYRFPVAPFGPAPDYVGPPMVQDGAEDLYTTLLSEPAANIGAAVIGQSEGALIDPWWLGSPDENDVEGYAGTPVNVNSLTFGYRADVGAAGSSFPRPQRWYVSVDSGRDPFTKRPLAGRYALISWVNDVFPPFVAPVTTRVAAGRPTLVAQVFDGFAQLRAASGVDPLSLVIGYGRVLVGAAFYDPVSGIAIFPLPVQAPKLKTGKRTAVLIAADNQEAKNLNTPGGAILPNTNFREFKLNVVNGPALTWLAPERSACAAKRTRLLVVASATRPIRFVRFFDGSKRIATVKRGGAGLYGATWRTKGAKKGKHVLRAVVTDRSGAKASATWPVRVCR